LCSLAKFDLANRCVRQHVQQHTFYARLLVFDKTSAQPHFAVVNCFDSVRNMFYSPVLTRNLCFCSCELLCRSVDFIFLRYPNVERWYFIFSAMTHKIRIVDVEKICILCQQTSPNRCLETWIWRKMWRHKQHTLHTNDHHMPLNETPHENFLRTPLIWTNIWITPQLVALFFCYPVVNIAFVDNSVVC